MPTLRISKEFSASKEQLYAAWTEPGQLKQWWKPLGKQLVDVESDIREGGSVRYGFDDDSLSIDGNYEKVVNNELLTYTWNWHSSLEPIHDAAYKLTVRFEGDENKSNISVSQQGFQNEESIQPHHHGWEQGLEQLRSFLEGQEKGHPDHVAEKQRPPVSGYNETPEQVKVGGG